MGPCVEDIVVRNSMVQSQFNLDTPFKIYFLVLSFIECGMILSPFSFLHTCTDSFLFTVELHGYTVD